jgi:hypothetical protein
MSVSQVTDEVLYTGLIEMQERGGAPAAIMHRYRLKHLKD